MHALAQFIQLERAHVLPAIAARPDEHGALFGIGQTWQQAGQHAFASTRGAHQGNDFAGLHGQAALVQNALPAPRRLTLTCARHNPSGAVERGSLAL